MFLSGSVGWSMSEYFTSSLEPSLLDCWR
uniref:Uncharacterized protein n=1 Tax=Arundo donax TaxID=35708 RepID=A0A0A8YW54_ARUDO